MKIGIIGAGISGLSIGQLLKDNHDVVLLEKNNYKGGIAFVDNIDGIPYHKIGGHCFNTKNKSVLDFVFKLMPESQWNKVERIAKIAFRGNMIDYPIEYSVQQIAKFEPILAYNITKDFFAADPSAPADNLAEWFRVKFGKTLAEEYLIPYNRKIWGIDPSEMSPDWVLGKLPLPNQFEFFNGLIGSQKDDMVHSTFYYPKINTQTKFIESLSQNLNIELNYEVRSIEKKLNGFVINNSDEFDLIISTMPLDNICKVLKCTEEIMQEAKKLKYNKISNMLWKSKPLKQTWTYFPEADTIFHRHIHIGNFMNPNCDYTITEALGEFSYEELKLAGEKFDHLIEPIKSNTSEHAYVVFDKNYKSSRSKIIGYLDSIGVYTIGRFGEWEYYNMDKCIESALSLYNKIMKN